MLRNLLLRTSLLWAALLPGGAPGTAQESSAVDFARDIQPLLKAHCLSCHGPEKQKGRLRLDSKAAALRGGVSGPVLVPGKAAESRLLQAILAPEAEDRMPKDAAPLAPAKISLLRTWIDQGALWPEGAGGPGAADQHWAHVKPVRREAPAVRDPAWARNPIDRFIAVERESRGLRPRPEASRIVLLRRLYLDLLGLPPTAEERDRFLSDSSPSAYEDLVDRLLADPRYGERWGRHWMDVWRYSDWAGFGDQIRESQRHIWRWRDWIVESLNQDKGYDRMILEMLAADELAPGDPQALRATGFLALNWNKFNRDAWLQNTVEHTSKAFLGTTMNCVRCHSHMFDPISHQEYYSFRAFFEPYNVRVDPLPGQTDVDLDGIARVFDADPAASTWLYIRGVESNPDKSKPLEPGVPDALGGIPLHIEPVSLPACSVSPWKQDFVRKDLLAAEAAAVEKARAKVESTRQEIGKQEALLAAGDDPKAAKALQAALEELPLALLGLPLAEAKRDAVASVLQAEILEEGGDTTSESYRNVALAAQGAQRRQAHLEAQRKQILARRTLARKRADDAAKKALLEADQAVAKAEADLKLPPSAEFVHRKTPSYPAESTGRRLALARWIASAENPLTARVAMNHLWMRHFGKPIVPTVFEFGRHGRPPSHPALLDWLATEFVREGWSMKKMHRLMVTSSAYRMESSADASDAEIDKDNRYLWRMNSRRMEAEAIRDSILQVAGVLDPAMGGPERRRRRSWSRRP